MCECLGGCSYELLSERLVALERELQEAVESGEQRRAARLRERIAELRCGCRRLQETAA
jgi:protein-arginine kinase activator protein McsA